MKSIKKNPKTLDMTLKTKLPHEYEASDVWFILQSTQILSTTTKWATT